LFKKILVPLDGSEAAEAVIPFAREIAGRSGGEVVLVTAVQQVGVWDATLSVQVVEREEESAKEYLNEIIGRNGTGLTAKTVQGDAAEAILSAAKEESADLIALSTHGRSGIARWLFGSTATHVLENSPVPVLFLRPKEGKDRGAPGPVVRKILVPLDGSDLAMSILPTVEEFAKLNDASIIYFHAVQPIAAYPGFEAQAASMGRITDELQDQARAILSRASEATRAKGIETSMVVNLDTPVDGTLRAAADLDVDLIALSSHGRGGLGRVILGSVADGIVRRSADVPCLVIRVQEED